MLLKKLNSLRYWLLIKDTYKINKKFYNLNIEFRKNDPIIQGTFKINHTLGSNIKTKFNLSSLNLKDQ